MNGSEKQEEAALVNTVIGRLIGDTSLHGETWHDDRAQTRIAILGIVSEDQVANLAKVAKTWTHEGSVRAGSNTALTALKDIKALVDNAIEYAEDIRS